MFSIKMPELKIRNLTARIPIIQGGMGVGISLSGLAAAVANEGGIGVISPVGLGLLNNNKPKFYKSQNTALFREEMQKARKLSNGIIGVNIMLALSDYDDLARIAFEEDIDIIFVGAGLMLKIPGNLALEEFKSKKTKVIPIVSSARAADLIFKTWEKNYQLVPDGVIVEGPLAGGHLGFKPDQIFSEDFNLEKIIPEVVSTMKDYEVKFNKEIPVVAAGGIFTGSDINKFLNLGAKAVQMGTRFVATNECDASLNFKNAYINSKQTDIQIIKSPVGLPGRAIASKFLEEMVAGLKKPFNCSWKCLKTCDFKVAPYCIANALIEARKGVFEKGFAFAGANVHRIKEIVSVKELMSELIDDFIAAKLLELKLI